MAKQPEPQPVDQASPIRVPTLLLTGVVGSGTSTIGAKIDDLLAGLGIPHAAVDLDALMQLWPLTRSGNNDVMFENLAAIWPNYSAHGATHLVLAGEFKNARDLDRCRAAIPGAEITVCRLIAPPDLNVDLLRERGAPSTRQWEVALAGEVDEILGDRGLADFSVENGTRPERDVAMEVLRRAEWVSNGQLHDLSVEPQPG